MTCSSPRGCYGNTVPWLKADMIVNRRDSSERCWLPGTEAGGVAPASHCFRAGRPADTRRAGDSHGRLAVHGAGWPPGTVAGAQAAADRRSSNPSRYQVNARPRCDQLNLAQVGGHFERRAAEGVRLISIRESCSARSWCATCALLVIRRIQAPPRAAENYGRLRPRIHRTPP